MRRILIIIIVGLALFSLLDWRIDYQISQYQQGGDAKQNHSSLFGGAVFLGIRDGLFFFWEWLHDNHDVLLVIFTAALFGVTTFLAYFTRGLMVYTRHLWGATGNLVVGAEDTAKKELRAYVGLDDLGLYFQKDTERPKIGITNFGKTPAKDMILYRRITEEPPSDIVGFTYQPSEGSLVFNKITVWPNQRLNQFWAADKLSVNEKFIYGYMEYSDIYDRRWRSRFAYFHRGGTWFTPHHEHNDEIEIFHPS